MKVNAGHRLDFVFTRLDAKRAMILDIDPSRPKDLMAVKSVLDSHAIGYTVTPRYSNGTLTSWRINVWLDQFQTNPSCPPSPPRELRRKPAPTRSAPTPVQTPDPAA